MRIIDQLLNEFINMWKWKITNRIWLFDICWYDILEGGNGETNKYMNAWSM